MSSTLHWKLPYRWGQNTHICQRVQTIFKEFTSRLYNKFLKKILSVFLDIPQNWRNFAIFLLFVRNCSIIFVSSNAYRTMRRRFTSQQRAKQLISSCVIPPQPIIYPIRRNAFIGSFVAWIVLLFVTNRVTSNARAQKSLISNQWQDNNGLALAKQLSCHAALL